MSPQATLRQATRRDYADLHRVRMAVRENRLGEPGRITEADYIDALAGNEVRFELALADRAARPR